MEMMMSGLCTLHWYCVYLRMFCLLPYVCLLKPGCIEFRFWLLVNFILFPGGGCKICGSVEHFRRDCPQLVQQNKGKKYLANTNYAVVFLVVINLIPFDVRSLLDINIVLNVCHCLCYCVWQKFLCQTQVYDCVKACMFSQMYPNLIHFLQV